MGLTIKSGLLELINTLTTSEKRYIKQFINKSGESKSNHAKLFDALLKAETKDEEKIRKKFKGSSIDKQWSRVKNYLYNYLLRILQSYYQQDAEFEISNNLQQVAILYRKGLYYEAARLLVKTKELAYNGTAPTLLPFIADWEMRLGRFYYYHEGKRLLDYQENNDWAIEVANNLLFYNRNRVDITENKLKKGRYIHLEEDNRNYLNSPIYKSDEQAKSPMAKWSFYQTLSTLHSQRGQYLEAYYETKKSFELHRTTPLLRKQAPLSYVTTVNSLLVQMIELKRWNEIPSVIQEIEPFIQKQKNSTIGILLTSIKYVILLKRSIGTLEYKEGLEYKQEIEAFIKQNEKMTDMYVQRHLLLHYLTHIYVVNGLFEDALKAIEEVEKIQQVPIYRNAILLLKLICLFEQDEILLLPYTIRSIYRNLLKKKNLFEFERIILNLLKTSINTASKSELKATFKKYFIKLEQFAATAPEAELELLNHFNYLAWMESKIEDKPLLEILESKANIVRDPVH